MTRTIKALFQELSLRQILMGSLLLVYLAGIIYSIVLISSLYNAKKEVASLRFASELDHRQAELDRIFLETETNVRHFASLAQVLTRLSPSELITQASDTLRAEIAESEMQFNGYFAFTQKFARDYVKRPGFGMLVTKNPKLASHPTFNDPVTFTATPFYGVVTDITLQRWYQQAIGQTQPVTSEFYYDPDFTKQLMISTTQGIFAPSGEQIGVAGIDTLGASLTAFLDRTRIGSTGGILLVNAEGQPVLEALGRARPLIGWPGSPEKSDTTAPVFSPEQRSIPPFAVQPNSFAAYRGKDGELYVTQARPLHSRPWSVVAYQSSREAYYAPFTHTLILIGLGVGFFSLFFWLGRQIASVLSGAVNNLVLNFNENSSLLGALEKGKKLKPAFPKGPKEFQYLALKLNELYDRLSRGVADLKQEATRAERATEAKSRFLSVMSHEIRTPLNSMLGLTDVLQRTPLDSEQQKYLRVLHRSGENLLRILNDILDFSRLEAGKLEVDYHEFDLYDLVNSVDLLKRLDAETKGIQLNVAVPPVNFIVLGDSTRLRQVLLNLVGNAVKFTEKGEVTLRISALHSLDSLQQAFHFEVSDSGIGIPQRRLKTIFQEFSQADRSISRRFGGTGLGLTITQQLLSLFGSTLEVFSEEGRGSTFSFRLELPVRSTFHAAYESPEAMKSPRNTEAALPASTEANGRPAAEAPTARVLVVDDDEDNHRLMSAYMRFHPEVEFDRAYDGLEALKFFRRHHYALIIMDMQMPEMDGLEAVRKIREEEAKFGHRKTPIIIVSANTYADDRRLSLEAGADDHVGKPIKLQTFTDVLSRYLAPHSS